MRMSIKGDRVFYEQVIACAEAALEGEYGQIHDGPNGHSYGGCPKTELSITFTPVAADGTGMAIWLEDITDAIGNGDAAWEGFLALADGA